MEAPPAPPKPAVRRGIVRISGDDPSYPREAIRAGVAKGRVVARLQIDEKGNVTEVNITSSEPRGVFDKVVRAALENWKFKAEGERYVGEVESTSPSRTSNVRKLRRRATPRPQFAPEKVSFSC